LNKVVGYRYCQIFVTHYCISSTIT